MYQIGEDVTLILNVQSIIIIITFAGIIVSYSKYLPQLTHQNKLWSGPHNICNHYSTWYEGYESRTINNKHTMEMDLFGARTMLTINL